MLYYIYCIWVKTENGVLRYYGHTENITVRKGKHVNKHKAWVKAGRPEKLCEVSGTTRSVYVLDHEDWRMDVKATVEHEDKKKAKDMARDKEGEFILENECVNMNVAGRTHQEYRETEEYKEYKKKYLQDHKDQIKEYQKQYREDHKEQSKEFNRQYYETHKEKIRQNQKEYLKQYRQDHRDKITAKQKEKVACKVCGSVVTKSNISIHQKTKKCLAAKISSPIITNADALPSSA